MAYGVIKILQSGTHAQILLQSGGVSYGSARVLNPNDGILYVARNRDCLSNNQGDWEWKIPSQSFAILPGETPGFSTLGLYYLDQSGANRPGEVTIYPSLTTVDDPTFISIGRAQLVYQSVLDITTGSQPAPPGVGNARLWVDGQNILHVLGSDNTDHVELDSTNFSTYVQPLINASITAQVPGVVGGTALGGDLYGTVNNGHVGLANGSPVYARDTGGTLRGILTLTTNDLWLVNAGGGQIRFINQASSAELGHFDNSGNLAVTAAITASGPLTANDIHTSRGNDTGVLYCGNSGSHYLYFDGTNWNLYGGSLYIQAGNFGVLGGGQDVSCGSVSITQGGNQVIYWRDGSHYLQYAPAGDTNTLYWTHILQVAMGLGVGQGIANGYRQELPNIAGKQGQALANAWATYSSVEHARQFGLHISGVDDPSGKLRAVKPVYYQHATIDEHGAPVRTDTGDIESAYTYGFAAADLLPVVPELVGVTDGLPVSILYDRLVAVLWAAVQDIDARLNSMEQLPV